MQGTAFLDLKVQINHPYLYTHAGGGCEHVLYIRQIRSRIPEDSNSIKCIFRRHASIPKCDLCELNVPVRISWNDVYAPKSPCFWCETCF